MLALMKVEPGNILKLSLNFSNFEPQYSYRLYSYKKKSVLLDSLLSELLSELLFEKIAHMLTATHSFAICLSGTFHIL